MLAQSFPHHWNHSRQKTSAGLIWAEGVPGEQAAALSGIQHLLPVWKLHQAFRTVSLWDCSSNKGEASLADLPQAPLLAPSAPQCGFSTAESPTAAMLCFGRL